MGPAAGSGSIRGCLALLTKAIGRAARGRLPSPPLPLCLRPPLPPSLSESPSPKTPSIASSPPRLRRPKPMDGLSSSSSDDIVGGGLSCVRTFLRRACRRGRSSFHPPTGTQVGFLNAIQPLRRTTALLDACSPLNRSLSTLCSSEPQLSRPKARRSASRTSHAQQLARPPPLPLTNEDD